MTKEASDLLTSAMYEIRGLRQENSILRARVDTMDTMERFLFAQAPSRSMGASEDLAWAIERHLEAAKKDEVREPRTAAGSLD